MQIFDTGAWSFVIGLGFIWAGALIVANVGLPRQLRAGETPQAEPGGARAFQLFWLDQYAWIGLSFCALGVVLAILGGAA